MKWGYRDESKKISQSVLAEKSTDDLLVAGKFIRGVLDLRKSEKLEKTYIQGTKKAMEYNNENRVYVDYKLDGTSTGRLSCAAYNAQKSMGVSFHTLPRETKHNIRSFFIAPKEHSFITVDYSAMELRVLAHVAKDGNMQKAFQDGADLHTYTARLLFNKEKITKQERQIAKTVSFLIVYGGGAFNLAETMGIPLKRAEKIIANYRKVYPAVFSFMEFVNEHIRSNGYAYTIFGRKRNLPDVYSRDRQVQNRALRQGLNFTIQSAASDILLCSLVGLYRKIKDRGMKSRIVATVHDSVELIAPDDEVDELCKLVHDEMVNYPFIKEHFNIHLDVPLAIEILVGKSFGDGEEVFV
tara:strand:- start:6279 stop:7340 length:1062 start_codon:yes stop_codon:yes gene_type:complete